MTSATPLITMATDMNVLDMPVDPNEPTYCLCQQVSLFKQLPKINKSLITWPPKCQKKLEYQKSFVRFFKMLVSYMYAKV